MLEVCFVAHVRNQPKLRASADNLYIRPDTNVLLFKDPTPVGSNGWPVDATLIRVFAVRRNGGVLYEWTTLLFLEQTKSVHE